MLTPPPPRRGRSLRESDRVKKDVADVHQRDREEGGGAFCRITPHAHAEESASRLFAIWPACRAYTYRVQYITIVYVHKMYTASGDEWGKEAVGEGGGGGELTLNAT